MECFLPFFYILKQNTKEKDLNKAMNQIEKYPPVFAILHLYQIKYRKRQSPRMIVT
jgi:hypothetical protein